MHRFQDGQIGTVVWHNAEFGEFISNTGARFTVRAREVQPVNAPAAPREMRRDAGEVMPNRRPRAPRFATGAALAAFIRRPFGAAARTAGATWEDCQ